MRFYEVAKKLKPGDLIYMFASPLEDRHTVCTYLVTSANPVDGITVEKPNGSVNTFPITGKFARNEVIIISDSSLVEFIPGDGWHFKTTVS